jgi:hypothetical protein
MMLTIDSVNIFLKDQMIPFMLHLYQANVNVNLFLCMQIEVGNSLIDNKEELGVWCLSGGGILLSLDLSDSNVDLYYQIFGLQGLHC